MNNQFLRHLNSITPQGRAEDTKIFVSAEKVNEAVSTNDPNRGKASRAKPKLPPGEDPYDMYSKGEIKPYGGKLQNRLNKMSPEDRKRYYQEVGIRSRAASRDGKTRRLFPMTEGAPLEKEGFASMKGQPKKSRRKLAYAMKSGNYRTALDRDTRKSVSNMRRIGAKLDKSVASFKSRHGISEQTQKSNSPIQSAKLAQRISRRIKKAKKNLRRIASGLINVLGTPQDNTDYMITGRKF